MLNVLSFLVKIVANQTHWVYIVCGIVIVWQLYRYAQARSDRRNTIFPVEREVAAHREGQAMSTIGVMLAICVATLAIDEFVLPAANVTELLEPTPTATLVIPTREITPTAVPTPEATPTPPSAATKVPTAAPKPTVAITNTPKPPPVTCPDPNTCITFPANGATVSGIVAIQGTANHPQFQFYKVEFGIGEAPDSWSSIGEVVRAPVNGGTLAVFNTQAVPNGTYTVRVVVVDITGNYPPPFAVVVNVQN